MGEITSIYVVTQKEPSVILDSHYKWIQSGTNDTNIIPGILHDNEIENNRADKNKFYSEYSAHYYIWKTDKKSDYIGLSHYRRYFDNGSLKIKPITQKRVNSILQKYDVILPYHEKFKYSIQDCYIRWHSKDDLKLLYFFLERYDKGFYNFFVERMKMHEMSMRNLFIAKREVTDKYWKWIFGLFDLLETDFCLGERDAYQSRVFGYFAERLLEPWMIYYGYKIKYTFIYNTDDCNNYKKRLELIVKDKIGGFVK